ncbi:hypothetical protein A8U91_00306 [Halomonas elongata]|uniref:Uncharacterized protein n=1 Tax=Halomonas elongata TaxID=2746 RepID=A0A1B8P164_HALEL|nr:hypothetical protein A8U91_00306 [Halomonas elongata]
MRLACHFFAIILLTLPGVATALEPEVQAAKDEGMRLYGLGISGEIIPYLEPAAEAGDMEAMYYLGGASASSYGPDRGGHGMVSPGR